MYRIEKIPSLRKEDIGLGLYFDGGLRSSDCKTRAATGLLVIQHT